MEVRKELLGMLPNELPVEETIGDWFSRGRGKGYQRALSDSADALTKRVVGVKELAKIICDPPDCFDHRGCVNIAETLHSKYIILERGKKR